MCADKREPEGKNHYNPAKAREYREHFQEKNPLGRTWNEHIAAWREEHPEYRERSNEYAKKSKLVAKLNLKKRLQRWGLAAEDAQKLLRLLNMSDLDRLALCLEHWDVMTGCAEHTPNNLIALVQKDDRTLLVQVLRQVKGKSGK